MTSKKRIVVMVGGAFEKAAATFAETLAQTLHDKFEIDAYDGAEAFRHLGRCHALVLAGLHAPESLGMRYEPLSRERKQSFGAFVSFGSPIVVTPEGVASFPDWPRFGELVGYELLTPLASPTEDDGICEVELYADSSSFLGELNGLRISRAPLVSAADRQGMEADVLALGHLANGERFPLAMCARGGPRPGAGLSLYMGLGPTWLELLGAAATARLWRRALLWLVGEAENAELSC